MRKEYETPTFEMITFRLTDVIMRSEAENVGGGGDFGGEGGFGDGGFGDGGLVNGGF